jgi:hypothetical protein
MSDRPVRERLNRAVRGEVVTEPVFAVYDWFVRNRPQVGWKELFRLGLGEINHADIIQYRRPHVEVVETLKETPQGLRRDTRWITDRGELHEWHLGEWRQEYLIKSVEDYRIMARAWEDAEPALSEDAFLASEAAVGDNGVTIAQLDRTPFQKIQIDYAGLERFSVDLAEHLPELFELIEQMNALKLREFGLARGSVAEHIKLWENLSIDTMGPHHYRRHLVPLYKKIFSILDGTGKRLQVHYDGKLRVIANDVAALPFDGLDSVTPPPEGDLVTAEARRIWPDKFLWCHPSLTWYCLSGDELAQRVQEMAAAAGPHRYCLMISEEVPPEWERTVPIALQALAHPLETE